ERVVGQLPIRPRPNRTYGSRHEDVQLGELRGLDWRKPIHFWFFTKANEPNSVPSPQSHNLKTTFTSVFINGINIASYPRARPQTLCLRAGLGDNQEGPTKSTYMEVRRVDSVVEFFGLVSHETSLLPFSLPLL